MMATRILSDAGGQDERDTSDVLSDIWLYRNWFGDAAGPVSQFDITMLMEVGDLQPNSLVSCDGGKSWMPYCIIKKCIELNIFELAVIIDQS